MEIERKWLIDGFPAGLPLLKEARVRQGYISTAPVVRIRESVNADGCRCVLCFKGEGTRARRRLKRIFLRNCPAAHSLHRAGPCDQGLQVYALPGGERWR
jgi:hypothetical protein